MRAIETTYKGYQFRSKYFPTEPMKKMSARADRTGKRFGKLLVIECLGIANVGYRWWGCVCDCGTRVAVRSRELDRGHTRSCGCLQAESYAERGGLNKLDYGRASRNELFASYKKSARNRGILWDLDEKLFVDLVSSPCTYCGAPPDTVRKPNKGVNGEFVYSGIDRVDNAIGYTVDNSVSCCWNCNRAKGTLGLDKFLEWCNRLNTHAEARQARFEFGESGI